MRRLQWYSPIKEVKSSGAELPAAMKVAPATSWLSWRFYRVKTDTRDDFHHIFIFFPPHLLCRWLIIFQHYNHLMPPFKIFNQMKRFVPLIFFPAMAQSKHHTLWPEHKTCRQPAKDTLESVWVRQASGAKPFHLLIFTEFCCCWKGLQLTQRTWRRTAPCLFCSTVKMSSGKSAMPAEMDRLIIDTFPGLQYRL